MKKIKSVVYLTIALLVFFLGLSFSYRNFEDVSVDYYVNVIQLPLAFVLLIALSIGVVLGFLVSIPVALIRRSAAVDNDTASLKHTK